MRRFIRTTSPTNAFEAVFLKDTVSETGQLRFLSRMSYIAMSHYLLYRSLLPKGVFKRRKLESMAIYSFDSTKRWGHKLSEMMRGIKEAIEKKYVKQAFLMLNEDSSDSDVATEVFSIFFCYGEQHTMAVLDDKGNRIVSFGYKGEKAFRMQVKHFIKKLSTVTKHLKPLRKGVTPYLKLTYYHQTPDDYEPPSFVHCENTYTFKTKPTFYNFGEISNKGTGISCFLESVYIDGEDVAKLDDLLFDEAGYKDNDDVSLLDVTADGFFISEDQSSVLVKSLQQPNNSSTTFESDESFRGLEKLKVVDKTLSGAIHANENIEKPRHNDSEETNSVSTFDSPVNISLADESSDSDEFVQFSKKVRDSPYVKARPKRSRLGSPLDIPFSKHVKSSVVNRSVLKSPTDDGHYLGSPIA